MNLKLTRIKNNLTQKELALLVGVSNVTIVKMEKEGPDSVKFGTLRKIAEVLNSSIEELFLDQ